MTITKATIHRIILNAIMMFSSEEKRISLIGYFAAKSVGDTKPTDCDNFRRFRCLTAQARAVMTTARPARLHQIGDTVCTRR